MSASPSIPESRSTSAILTVLGREAPTRTPTDCCASISRGERVSPTTPRNTWTWLPPSSMGDLAKPSAGRRRLSDSPSFWEYRQQQVLRPPHEPTRQNDRLGGASYVDLAPKRSNGQPARVASSAGAPAPARSRRSAPRPAGSEPPGTTAATTSASSRPAPSRVRRIRKTGRTVRRCHGSCRIDAAGGCSARSAPPPRGSRPWPAGRTAGTGWGRRARAAVASPFHQRRMAAEFISAATLFLITAKHVQEKLLRKSHPGEDEQATRRSRLADEKEPSGSFS